VSHVARPSPPTPSRLALLQVPLKPFEATIRFRKEEEVQQQGGASNGSPNADFAPFPSVMCTPQSFPPTPISRACVMAR
jgi:hypothetical protein